MNKGRGRPTQDSAVVLRSRQRVLRLSAHELRLLDAVARTGTEHFSLHPGPTRSMGHRLLHCAVAPVPLNTLVPLLDNLGLLVEDEHDFNHHHDTATLYLKSFTVRVPQGGLPLEEVGESLLQLLTDLRSGTVENDDLNRLLLSTGLDRYQIDIFRGYRNYLFQLGAPFARHRVALALIAHPAVTRLLYRYFAARFDPEAGSIEEREDRLLPELRQALLNELEAVVDANFDRILRTLFNLIDATVRTSFFRRRDRPDYLFAFKISDLGLLDLPASRALYEIYVHAASMEGIHLRGGLVARGGIRWSERPDDFRSEILGLLKTQMSKNVVIVPVGSKGGFVVKGPPTVESGRAAYATLIRGLLDLTDNRIEGRVVHPAGVIAYDGDDPYLVVAADKGTAHFSDLANAISAEYGFWLGDAFASGGSHGYDHKQLAITARGAWECVKSHFRELGRDIEREPVSVVGIGDMSGDVFGNGMLRAPTIRLRAAFDHRHIFLDPDPDPASSFRERERLFALPASSWDDYDRAVLSPGGGIFRRDAKEIVLSPPVRTWLNLRQETIDPPGLIRRLLVAEVDLLWNGGIGTYIKGTEEKHDEVGDRANDGVRIDGRELRALVVGEGGNLGLTQRGRIEYALGGGHLNTDAIDNSGGVDCSDHEVNLKIFLGQLAVPPVERDRLLQEVSSEVCEAVLEDNRLQSLCLSLDERRCRAGVEPFLTLIARLHESGLLDRKGEQLPDAETIADRVQPVLTRPELAVLMPYAKMQLYQALLEQPLPGAEVDELLAGYFPALLRERFGEQMAAHPLARELTATVLANRIVNQGGSTLVLALQRRTGAVPSQVAQGYLFFDRLLDAPVLRRQLRALSGNCAPEPVYRQLLRLEEVLAGLCRALLAAGLPVSPDLAAHEYWRQRLTEFCTVLPPMTEEGLWSQSAADLAALRAAGLAPETAAQLAGLEQLADWWPTLALAERTGARLTLAWQALTAVRARFALPQLGRQVAALPGAGVWERQARESLEASLAASEGGLAELVIREGDGSVARYLERFPRAAAVAVAAGAAADAAPSLAALLEILQQLQGLLPREKGSA